MFWPRQSRMSAEALPNAIAATASDVYGIDRLIGRDYCFLKFPALHACTNCAHAMGLNRLMLGAMPWL